MPPRIALVHDYLLVMRGAERTFAAIADCFPEADIFTLLYDREGTGGRFEGRPLRTSYLQRLGVGQRGFRRLLPLFPSAAERLPLDAYDLVISSSSAFAHGVRARADAVHVCYCHSPFRYAWHEYQRALDETPPPLRPTVALMLKRIRRWDTRVARRTSAYIANSELTRARIADWWRREPAAVVHPPVDVERFRVAEPEDYFLIVTELVRHKRVEIALEAAKRSGRRIKVVGTGPELASLRQRYAGTAEFLGRVDDAALADMFSRSLAYVMPNVEEFGIAAVESMASGRPVLAANAGGAQETVVEGKTGVLVSPGDVDGLAKAMTTTNFDAFRPHEVRSHAMYFGARMFQERLIGVVADVRSRAL